MTQFDERHDAVHPEAVAPRDEEFQEGAEEPPPGVRIASTLRWIALGLSIALALGTTTLALGWGPAASQQQAYHCPMHPTVVSDRQGECPICGMDLVPIGEGGDAHADHGHAHHGHGDEDAEILAVARQLGAKPGQWVCPMPEDGVVSDEPGRCEICGMRLVQVPDPEDPALALHAPVPGLTEVTIPSERLAKIGVRTARVEEKTLRERVRTVGVVAVDERRRALVQARFSGWVEELLVAEEGVWVEAGQPLARVYSPDLVQAQTDLIQAVRFSPNLRATARKRLEYLGIAPEDVRRVERTGKVQSSLTLRARKSGHVIAKGVTQGAYVSPGDVLFEIADLGQVWVVADVFEQDLPRVQAGATARFVPAVAEAEGHVGTIALLQPTVDPTTRTVKARLEVPNEAGRLRPGMFGDVQIAAEPRQGPVVPRDAVIDAGEHVYTLVARGGGRFVPREVRVLARDGEQVLVDGLAPGEEVVTSAGFFIDAESRLRAALNAMDAGPATADEVHGHDVGGTP